MGTTKGIRITKQNGNICFNEFEHKYWDKTDPSKHFISVTTLIECFGQPFDKEFWSAYKALEKLLDKEAWLIEKKSLLQTKKFDKALLSLHDISEDDFNREQQSILDSWEEENKNSCERGTKIHADLENSFYKKKKNIDISKYQIGGTFECRKDYTALDLENAVYPEYLIHRVTPDGKLCIAGQIDLLVKKGNHITIGDWKGLPLDTSIPTLEGWSTIADLKVGDIIWDMEGNPTKILHKSHIHVNPCYKITFDNGDSIVADHEHRWVIIDNEEKIVTTTEEIRNYKFPRIPIAKPIKPNSFGYTLISAIIGNKKSGYYLFKATSSSEFITVQTAIARCGIKSWVNKELLAVGFYVEDFLLVISHQWNKIVPERKFRTITSVVPVETIQTQCLEVDSPTHTFLCTDQCIVTHNTNKKIETKGFFDSKSKSTTKMKYPLNNLEECNYSHYCLQLSTYAWMLQKLNPDFVIDDLVLVHFDHADRMTVYHLPYLKEEVQKMLAFYKKQAQLNEREQKRKKIEY